MTAAVRVLVDHVLTTWQLNRVEIVVATENRRSRAIPERLGYREEGTLREYQLVGDRCLDCVSYSTLAPDDREVPAPVLGLDHVQVAAPAGSEGETAGSTGTCSVSRRSRSPKPSVVAAAFGSPVALNSCTSGAIDDFSPATKAHPALRVGGADLNPVAERLAAAGSGVQWDDAIPGTCRFYTADPWGNRIELLAVN